MKFLNNQDAFSGVLREKIGINVKIFKFYGLKTEGGTDQQPPPSITLLKL